MDRMLDVLAVLLGVLLGWTHPSGIAPPDHVAAATIAGLATGTNPALLLSIAYHESRFEPDVVTPEVGGKVSCGAMTPYPKQKCETSSLLAQYMDGAIHLRGWMRATHSMQAALTGFAGGYALLELCKHREHPGCHTWEVFLRRADRFRAKGGSI